MTPGRKLLLFARRRRSPYRLRDTYTDANLTALPAHQMDVGAGWRADAGSWVINGNVAEVSALGAGLFAAASAEASVPDAVVSAVAGSASGIGVIARLLDGSNFWLAHITAVAVQLYEVNAGVFTLQAQAAATPGPGDIVSLTASGTSLFASVGAVSTPTHVNNFLASATRFGIYGSATTRTLDTFSVLR